MSKSEEIEKLKRTIPLGIWESLVPFLDESNQFITPDTNPEKHLLNYRENRPGSDFYFSINKHVQNKGFLVSWKPGGKDTIERRQKYMPNGEIHKYFQAWIELVKGFNTVRTPYDVIYADDVEEVYSKEYQDLFLIDKSDESRILRPAERFLIEDHLDHVTKTVTQFSKSQLILENEILDKAKEIKENLTKPKSWIVVQISILWAKITKLGKEAFQEMTKDFLKKLMREGGHWIKNNQAEILKTIIELPEKLS
ncbi:MAG: hypothetical protein R2813_03380 [Flavobacteriales bacterium]